MISDKELSLTFGITLAILGFFVIGVIWYCGRTNNGDGVQTDLGGETRIVEISTHDEKHEYILLKQAYGRGLCHVPNCKYCVRSGK
jgi:hypothetical protein